MVKPIVCKIPKPRSRHLYKSYNYYPFEVWRLLQIRQKEANGSNGVSPSLYLFLTHPTHSFSTALRPVYRVFTRFPNYLLIFVFKEEKLNEVHIFVHYYKLLSFTTNRSKQCTLKYTRIGINIIWLFHIVLCSLEYRHFLITIHYATASSWCLLYSPISLDYVQSS